MLHTRCMPVHKGVWKVSVVTEPLARSEDGRLSYLVSLALREGEEILRVSLPDVVHSSYAVRSSSYAVDDPRLLCTL